MIKIIIEGPKNERKERVLRAIEQGLFRAGIPYSEEYAVSPKTFIDNHVIIMERVGII